MKTILLLLLLLTPCRGQLQNQQLPPMILGCIDPFCTTRQPVMIGAVRAVKFTVEVEEIALRFNWMNADNKFPCLVVTNALRKFPNGKEFRESVSFQMRRERRSPFAKIGVRYYTVILPEDFVKASAGYPIYFDMRSLKWVTFIDYSQTI